MAEIAVKLGEELCVESLFVNQILLKWGCDSDYFCTWLKTFFIQGKIQSFYF